STPQKTISRDRLASKRRSGLAASSNWRCSCELPSTEIGIHARSKSFTALKGRLGCSSVWGDCSPGSIRWALIERRRLWSSRASPWIACHPFDGAPTSISSGSRHSKWRQGTSPCDSLYQTTQSGGTWKIWQSTSSSNAPHRGKATQTCGRPSYDGWTLDMAGGGGPSPQFAPICLLSSSHTRVNANCGDTLRGLMQIVETVWTKPERNASRSKKTVQFFCPPATPAPAT